MSVIARERRIAMPADAPRGRSSDAWRVHSELVTEQAGALLEAADGGAQAGRDDRGKRPCQRPAGPSSYPRLPALLAVMTQTREREHRQGNVTAGARTKGIEPCHTHA